MDRQRSILELKQVHKSFRNKDAELKVLEEISFTVYAGEIIALLGPSGCGKSTLLNIVSGLIEPDQGHLQCEAGLRLAYVFQEPRLLPWKTIEENIRFVQDNFLPASQGKDVREDLLRKTGLRAYADAYPDQLSGGMKQRLEIARALSIQPQLLLMDEPFKSADLALKYQLQELILAEHAREQLAVLYITHDPNEAVRIADRIFLFSDKPTKIQEELVLQIPQQKRRGDPQVQAVSEKILDFLLQGGDQQNR